MAITLSGVIPTVARAEWKPCVAQAKPARFLGGHPPQLQDIADKDESARAVVARKRHHRWGTRNPARRPEALARDRDAARKKKADAERHRLQNSQSVGGTEKVFGRASQFDRLKTESALGQAISWALQMKDEPPCEPPDKFSS